MPDLVEWLETAIGEAERLATAREETEDGWTETGWWVTRRTASGDLDPLVHHSEDQARTALARHQNPDTVLRRCAADRKLIAEVRRAEWTSKNTGDAAAVAVEIGLRSALKIVAEGYGYQEVAAGGDVACQHCGMLNGVHRAADHMSCGSTGTGTSA